MSSKPGSGVSKMGINGSFNPEDITLESDIKWMKQLKHNISFKSVADEYSKKLREVK
jgi:hypothetical protein